jgi:Flp pilus assembly protein TadG
VSTRRATYNRKRLDERGIALVEFALLLPFIAMLVFGTVDLSRGFTQQNRLKNASREGAALARLRPNQLTCPGGIRDRVFEEDDGLSALSGFNVSVVRENGSAITQTCNPLPVGDTRKVAAGNTVIVRVQANLNLTTPFVGIVTGNPIRQTAETKVVVHE